VKPLASSVPAPRFYTASNGAWTKYAAASKRIVIVGNAEAPVNPAIIEGYRTMGALTEDEALMALDNSTQPYNRRALPPVLKQCGVSH
jgi:hypothetical protein